MAWAVVALRAVSASVVAPYLHVRSLDNSTVVVVGGGGVDSVHSPGQALPFVFDGSSSSLGNECLWTHPPGDPIPLPGGGGRIWRLAECALSSAVINVSDTFTPAHSTVQWTQTFAIVSSAKTFTTALGINLYPASGRVKKEVLQRDVWMPWTRGCVENGYPFCIGSGPWQDPFEPVGMPVPEPVLYRYGDRAFQKSVLGGLGVNGTDDSFTLPMATFTQTGLESGAAAGMSLMLSPADNLLDIVALVNSSRFSFHRYLHRLENGREYKFTSHIAAHRPGWRPALNAWTKTYSESVLPHVSQRFAATFDGLGAYTSAYTWKAPTNATYAAEVGFKTNWDLSGTFMPFQGLYGPFQETWFNLGPGPLSVGLPRYQVSYEFIHDHYSSIQKAGLNSLMYFNVGEFGNYVNLTRSWPNITCGVRPSGIPAPCPTSEGSSAYVQHYLNGSMLTTGWSMDTGSFEHPFQKTEIVMDVGVPFFRDMLLEELSLRLEKVPITQGIAIDRFDFSSFYNYNTDDGESWVPQLDGSWGKAGSLLVSFREMFKRVSSQVHAGKERMMLGNCNGLCRIDLLAPMDGSFSEGAALNAVAWTGLRRLSILWTYNISKLESSADKDAFFQKHLLMRVFPMAPVEKNDHSIQPGDSKVQKAYADYAPLFDALRGCEWALDLAQEIVLERSSVTMKTNVFQMFNGSSVVVAVLGDRGDTSIGLRVPSNAATGSTFAVWCLTPGSGREWTALGRVEQGRDGYVDVPTVPLSGRGGVLVRLDPSTIL
eukprot:Hpha_TRINITY_DN18967_c0_g1::TRINITY_DN18967_c0_g1_i1::g.17568::m.17568